MAIALVGFMGAGKSTIGPLIAEQLRFAFLDIDSAIEESLALPITEIFARYGEDYFRDREARAIHSHAHNLNTIIALGAGAIENAHTRSLLKNLLVVYLEVPLWASLARIAPFETRPLATRPDINEIYQRRAVLYAEVATIRVDTSGREPNEIASEIVKKLTTFSDTQAPSTQQSGQTHDESSAKRGPRR